MTPELSCNHNQQCYGWLFCSEISICRYLCVQVYCLVSTLSLGDRPRPDKAYKGPEDDKWPRRSQLLFLPKHTFCAPLLRSQNALKLLVNQRSYKKSNKENMRTRNSKVYSEFGRTEAPKIGPRPHWLPKSKQTPDREDLPIPPEPTPNRLVELEGVIEFHSAMGGLLKPNGQPITKNDIYAYFETLSRTDTGSVATRNAVEGPLQPEEEEKDEEDFNDFDAEIFNPEKVELIAAKASTMKRKEFSLNPVCCNCKQQYNEDDNPDGCCTYHRG